MKCARTKNSHYSPIILACMNTHSGKASFKNFQILLDSGSSSTIVIRKLTSNNKSKEITKNMQETQARKFTTSKKVNIDLCLPDFNATKIITWKLHVKESTNSIYNITLSKDLLIALELDINFSEDVIIGGEGPYEG